MGWSALGALALSVALAACDTPGQSLGATAPPSAAGAVQPTREAVPGPPFEFSPDILAATLRELGSAHLHTPTGRGELEALYATPTALWLDAAGHPTIDADDALALLASCDTHGLRPESYQASILARQAHRLLTLPAEDVAARVRFDALLSLQVMRYWRHLHLGRIDPRTLGFRLTTPVDDHDFPAMLRAAVAAHQVGAATNDLVPPLVSYRALVTALSRYRALAPRAEPLTLPTPKRSFKPGEPVDGLSSLRVRLMLLGDLPEDAPAAGGVYEGLLVEGVRRFQVRHGLDPDGVLGRSTLAALQVPLGQRIEQIELALERLRWLPHVEQDGYLVVNIPMFRVWGWGPTAPDGSPSFDMGVIVGRALNTETPVFSEEMQHLIFRPYWNVPPSILRGEVLPAIARDPRYLARNEMEIVDGPGDDARVVPQSEQSLALLRQGRLRVRQRPGAKNSLGLVKFVFPNDDNIYMHGTPAPQLFGRARRDFSHGCVRVEDPVALAVWALRHQPEWTRERIEAEMRGGGVSRRVDLARRVQVILFYLTAFVWPSDGAVHFADDIYGHDRRLARALERAAPDRGSISNRSRPHQTDRAITR